MFNDSSCQPIIFVKRNELSSIGWNDKFLSYLRHMLLRYFHKSFPNYALMKISAYHKSRGDTVEWWCALDNDKYDRIYSSKVFDFTEENPFLPSEKTIKGGTGYGIFSELPAEIDEMFPDYSIYPNCDYAIGFLTRGCPNKCPWCYVPQKEGNIHDNPELIGGTE